MLGYGFKVNSHHSPDDAKRLLRQGMKPWLDAKNGPRGWIVGPFLCLWLSAINQQGPMVVGYIAQDSLGTKIVGRAGADLNGTLYIILMLPIVLFILTMMHLEGQGSATIYAVFAVLFGVGLPLTLWFNFKARKEADPLVRFVRRTLGEPQGQDAKVDLNKKISSQPISGLTMEVDGAEVGYPPSEKALLDVLDKLEPGGFVILSFGPETFMQTALEYDRFVLERRDGNRQAHWRRRELLKLDDVFEEMCRYLNGPSGIDEAQWRRISF